MVDTYYPYMYKGSSVLLKPGSVASTANSDSVPVSSKPETGTAKPSLSSSSSATDTPLSADNSTSSTGLVLSLSPYIYTCISNGNSQNLYSN